MTPGEFPSADLIHTFVIWNGAVAHQDVILDDLRSSFPVLGVWSVEWAGDRFRASVRRAEAVLGGRHPIGHHPGNGPLLLVVVRVDRSQFAWFRSEATGWHAHDAAFFEAVARYERRSGHNDAVTLSSSTAEARRTVALLVDDDLPGEVLPASEMAAGRTDIVAVTKEPAGVGGWPSGAALFGFMNRAIEHVVLRNFDDLPRLPDRAPHGDVDILVRNRNQARRVLGVERSRVTVAGMQVPVDLHDPADGRYSAAWAGAMLDNRVDNGNGVPVLGVEDRFYALLYHALVHKRTISADYHDVLCRWSKPLGLEAFEPDLAVPGTVALLRGWLERNGYAVRVPRSYHVGFNGRTARSLGLGAGRTAYGELARSELAVAWRGVRRRARKLAQDRLTGR